MNQKQVIQIPASIALLHLKKTSPCLE